MLQLVLFTTVIFFVFSLSLNVNRIWKNIKQAKGIKWMLSVVWVLMFLGLGVFFQRSELVSGLTSLDKSAMFQFFCYGLAGLILFLYLLGNQISKGLTLPLLSLISYSLIAIISAVYSPIPIISFYKGSVLLIVAILFVSCIYTFSRKGNGYWLLEISYFISALFCFGAVLGALIWPEVGLQPSRGSLGVILYGTFPVMNANELGSVGFYVFVIGLRRSFEKIELPQKFLYLSFTLLGFVVLFMAQSRTALIATLIALIIMAITIARMRLLLFLGLFLFSVSIIYQGTKTDFNFTEIIGDSALEYAQRGQKEGGLQTFNDRIDVWQSVGLSKLAEAPFMGHGFELGVAYDVIGKYGRSHLHNSHFQILANNGILGYVAWLGFFIPVCLFIFIQVKRHLPCRNSEDRYYIESAVIALGIALRTMTGSVLVSHQWSLMIFAAIYIYFETERRKRVLEIRYKSALLQQV
jgi:O-antigen ligase